MAAHAAISRPLARLAAPEQDNLRGLWFAAQRVLLDSRLRSLAETAPATLAVLAAETGVWSYRRAAHILCRTDAVLPMIGAWIRLLARGQAVLHDKDSRGLRENQIPRINRPEIRARALIELSAASSDDEHDQCTRAALLEINSIGDESHQLQCLLDLAANLPLAQRQFPYELSRRLLPPDMGAGATACFEVPWSELIGAPCGEDAQESALRYVLNEAPERHRKDLLGWLIPCLVGRRREEAVDALVLELLRLGDDEFHFCAELGEAASCLRDSPNALKCLMSRLSKVAFPWIRHMGLRSLSTVLSKNRRLDGNLVRGLLGESADPGLQAAVLTELALRAPMRDRRPIVLQALDFASRTQDYGAEAEFWATVSELAVPSARQQFWTRTLLLTQRIVDPAQRAVSLAKTLVHCPLDERDSHLAQALSACRTISCQRERCGALTNVVRALPEDRREEVLAHTLRSVLAMDPGGEQCQFLVQLAPFMGADTLAMDVLPRVLAGLALARDPKGALAAFGAVFRQDASALGAAITAVGAIEDSWNRAQAFEALANAEFHDSNELAEQNLSRMVAIVQSFSCGSERLTVRIALLPALNWRQKREQFALAIKDVDEDIVGLTRADALARLALMADGKRRTELARRAIGEYLHLDRLQSLMASAGRTEKPTYLSQLLSTCPDLFESTLQQSLQLSDPTSRARLLANMSGAVPREFVPIVIGAIVDAIAAEVAETTRTSRQREANPWPLIGAFEDLSLRIDIVDVLFESARALKDSTLRARLLEILAPSIARNSEWRAEAIVMLDEAGAEACAKANALVALAVNWPDYPTLLSAVRSLTDVPSASSLLHLPVLAKALLSARTEPELRPAVGR